MPPHRHSHARSLPTHLNRVRRSSGGRDAPAGAPHRGRGTTRARLRALVIGGEAAGAAAAAAGAGSLVDALGEADVAVIGVVPSAHEGLELARNEAPDLVFVDLVTGADGLALIRRLGSLDRCIRAVLVTPGCDPDEGVAAIRAGARAFMARPELLRCSLARLVEAVMADKLVCSRSMAMAMADRLNA